MKIIVSGGRDFSDVALLWRTLDELHAGPKGPITLLVEGASDDATGPYIGADFWAHQWALANRVAAIREHADWNRHGRAAGPIRNGLMLSRHKPDRLVAFPGRRGTADMVAKANKAKLIVQTVRATG